MLPEILENFLSQAPISLKATQQSSVSLQQIKDFYEENIASKVKNKVYGELCHAALMLAFDYIWEAHEIIQVHPQMEASWWHAYMHRMEGDHGNSAYWYQRVTAPKEFLDLQNEVNQLDLDKFTAQIKSEKSWNPIKFNKLIKQSEHSSLLNLQKIHRLEFKFLLYISYKTALQ